MTANQKYENMNNEFCKLRDAIYESNVVEKDEDPIWDERVQVALGVILTYIDYYKELNNVKSHVKGTIDEQQNHLTGFINKEGENK